jgi:hypothetical protein
VDYSRHQRREIQMDLFGRELLLPRQWVRSRHLEGMTASQIAERIGAPFDVVALQLLDALLLPQVELESEGRSEASQALNEEQRRLLPPGLALSSGGRSRDGERPRRLSVAWLGSSMKASTRARSSS